MPSLVKLEGLASRTPCSHLLPSAGPERALWVVDSICVSRSLISYLTPFTPHKTLLAPEGI